MDDGLITKIFEPFFTTKEKEKGTGLGLSTVYGIVKQNKGCINVHSEPGTGTGFEIYWPSFALESIEEEAEVSETAIPEGSETILIVEDDPQVREFAVLGLQSLGYTIYETENGEDALSMLKERNYSIDLIITDMVMPKMGGKELADELKKVFPGGRILFTSGYIDQDVLEGGRLEEGIDFIQKPYAIDVIARKVREILDR
jgi:CheY-like chemotaxis protein